MQMTPAVVLGHTVTIALSNLLNQLVTKSVLNTFYQQIATQLIGPNLKKCNLIVWSRSPIDWQLIVSQP